MTVWRSVAISAVPLLVYIVFALVILGAACRLEDDRRACIDRILEAE